MFMWVHAGHQILALKLRLVYHAGVCRLGWYVGLEGVDVGVTP